jgi:hypothetical protein
MLMLPSYIDNILTTEEIEKGYADFDSWCELQGITVNNKRVRRNAEVSYKRALKRLMTKRRRNKS